MSIYLERAQELRAITDPHYNCAQSVFIPFAEQTGMTTDEAYAVAQAFGGGMQVGSVCGALTGALMALGVLGLASHDNVTALTQRMAERHEGATMCADLLRQNEEAGGVKKAFCDSLIYDAIGMVEECLEASQNA